MFNRNKYNARKTVIFGVTFDSKKESHRYLILLDMQARGKICRLTMQPRFVLIDTFTMYGRKIRQAIYTADFQYKEGDDWIVEDVKSVATAKIEAYRLRKKLFIKRYGKKYIFREVIM